MVGTDVDAEVVWRSLRYINSHDSYENKLN